MKRSLILFLAATVSTVTPSLASYPQSNEASYEIYITLKKDNELIMSRTVMLMPLAPGMTGTYMTDGIVHQLKYSGIAARSERNGETTSYVYSNVTTDDHFLTSTYKADTCQPMRLNKEWPLTQTEYQVTSADGTCTLTVVVSENEQSPL